MRSKFLLLVRAGLPSIYSGQRTGLAAGKRRGGRAVLYAVLAVYFCGIAGYYSFTLAKGLSALGMDPSPVIALMLLASSLMCLIFGVTTGGRTLFQYKDYDLVTSMPVSIATVAASRIFLFTLMQEVYSVALLIPAGVAYAVYGSPGPLFWPFYIVLTLLAPMVPTILSAILSTLLTAAASRFARIGNAVNIVLMLALVAGIVYGTSSLTRSAFAVTASMGGLTARISAVYPLTAMFTRAAAETDPLSMLSFALISAAVFAAFCLLISTRYREICSRVMSVGGKVKKLRDTDIRARGQSLSLYVKEWRLYLSSVIWVVNSSIGVLLALVVSVFVAATGGFPSFLLNGISAADLGGAVNGIAFGLVSMFLGMSCTSCSSLSMEGEGIWVLKALPVRAWQVFKAKILLNLTLTGTGSIVCAALLCAAFRPAPLTAAAYFLLPLALAGFAAVFGVFINLRFPKLNWTSETQVVKQSAASMAGMMIPFGIGMALLIACTALQNAAAYVALGACVLLLAAALVLADSLKRNGEQTFLKLGE